MSCFLCSFRHIATIASSYAVNVGASNDEARLIANELLAVNIHSVNERYDENTPVMPCRMDSVDWSLSPADLVKLCDCLDYQSCEAPGYDPLPIAIIRAAFGRDVRPGDDSDLWSI